MVRDRLRAGGDDPARAPAARFGFPSLRLPEHHVPRGGRDGPRRDGTEWDDYVREKFFAPLGMTRSNTNSNSRPRRGTSPRRTTSSRQVWVIHFVQRDASGGAAASNSSASEMARGAAAVGARRA